MKGKFQLGFWEVVMGVHCASHYISIYLSVKGYLNSPNELSELIGTGLGFFKVHSFFVVTYKFSVKLTGDRTFLLI